MLGLYIFIYMLIGAFMLEMISNVYPDIGCNGAVDTLIVCFWPLIIVVAILAGVVCGVMGLGRWLGKLIRRTFIEKERSE